MKLMRSSKSANLLENNAVKLRRDWASCSKGRVVLRSNLLSPKFARYYRLLPPVRIGYFLASIDRISRFPLSILTDESNRSAFSINSALIKRHNRRGLAVNHRLKYCALRDYNRHNLPNPICQSQYQQSLYTNVSVEYTRSLQLSMILSIELWSILGSIPIPWSMRRTIGYLRLDSNI